ncbi:UvrD-helicase domain-containing protein [Agrobacterium rubi]|nr:UvrD-helicase domain-containing protein [Agrobacterium rubi]NTF24798.1 UvrD-helicase domain-containing protein [Agrobacterium rubi]
MTTNDSLARTTALTALDKSLQVEAGAGSGKTSLLAGRIVANLANGVHPRSIAAVSFTEKAAAELMARVSSFIDRVIDGDLPDDIAAAFPGGATPEQLDNLFYARTQIGQLICTTIHGFCQRIIQPYPVEANIDPGAQILDPVDAGLAFDDIFNAWLRSRLAGHDPNESLITTIITNDPKSGLALIRQVADILRENPSLKVEEAVFGEDVARPFGEAVAAFEQWYSKCGYVVPEHDQFLDAFRQMRTVSGTIAKAHTTAITLAAAIHGSFLFTAKKTIRAYKVKSKWEAAAPSKAQGRLHFEEAMQHYESCSSLLVDIQKRVAAAALYLLHREVEPVIKLYSDFKRDAAFLDFGDLLVAAHRLLENYPDIRAALGDQYLHVLVDEFQDTDPLQTQIFLHLAFDMVDGQWKPRAGSIFLVGDSKQAIYRFRGADVATYVRMREIMRAADPSSVLSVSTNFRSLSGVLDHVNAVFENVLSVEGQPGFTALSAHRTQKAENAVAFFDVDDQTPRDDGSEPKIGDIRDREARAVAEICTRLIGSFGITKNDGGTRPCQPGDIALLVPQGTELWRYENALEDAGIAVATQAGKGLYRQQEIQDLIALTRILADTRDTMALGAFLRGPLVGLTEQELLDETHRIAPSDDGTLQFLRVGMDTTGILNPILADIMGILEELRGRAEFTTPHGLLNMAIDRLRVRPKIVARFIGNPERQLSNVDRFLEMSRPYSVRGLRAFSDAMRTAWEDGDRVEEGRPDEHKQSVSLITMHSAKGLEWPVVIPVNIITSPMKQSSIITDVSSSTMTMPFMGLLPSGYEEALIKAERENAFERMRIWYVATTRARDLLILPRYGKEWPETWFSMLDLRFDLQDALDLSGLADAMPKSAETAADTVDEDGFRNQMVAVAASTPRLVWTSPSRHEWSPALSTDVSDDELVNAVPLLDPYAGIGGGAERGTILHKLMEEILNGELSDDHESIHARAAVVSAQYAASVGRTIPDLFPDEMARTVRRTLEIPIVKTMRSIIIPELVTAAVSISGGGETIEYGVIDAVAIELDGLIRAVFDWKSDIRPSASATRGYAKQVGRYIEMNEVEVGYIVYMTTGEIVEIRNKALAA